MFESMSCCNFQNSHRLNDGCNSGAIRPHLSTIFQFIEVASQENDEDCIIKNSIGLIGDLATSLMIHAVEVILVSFTLLSSYDEMVGCTVFPSRVRERLDL